MTVLLSIHPLGQLAAILACFYAAYFGYRRVRSLHLGAAVRFPRKVHAAAGAVALIAMLVGSGAGSFMKEIYLQGTEMELHEGVASIILALGILGIFSGYILYSRPRKRKILPAIHGVVNFTIILLALVQVITGTAAYLRYVLRW